jgi:fructoselysine 6-kinase
MRVIGIGDNVVDDYTNIRTMFPGGNALNFSVYATMLGCEAAYLGVFGSDAAAEHVQCTAARLGIDTSHCLGIEGPNGRAELTHQDGERIFLGSNEGGISKSVPMAFAFEDTDYLKSFAIAHTSAYSYIDHYLSRFNALGLPVSYDFSDDFDKEHALSLCPYVDYGFFSCAEWSEGATKALLADAVSNGCKLVVATRGAAGAILFDGEYWFEQPPHPVTPIDTLGAGDAFISGFLVSWIGAQADADRAASIQYALGKGAAFAAEICLLQGAFGHGLRY